MAEHVVALVGLPETGKTTFLAAFWAAVRDMPPATIFTIRVWPDSPDYLQSIADHWFAGEPVGRTSADTVNEVFLALASRDNEVDLVFPDLSGETFKAAVVRRTLPATVDELLQQASGILLFINCSTATSRLTITDARALLEVSNGADYLASPGVPFLAEDLETEVLTAELLQVVVERCSNVPISRGLRIGVVLSAWDVVPEGAHVLPFNWLRTNQSLVSSLVEAVGDTAKVRVFGVSAQGGDYNVDSDIRSRRPTERPVVVDEEDVPIVVELRAVHPTAPTRPSFFLLPPPGDARALA